MSDIKFAKYEALEDSCLTKDGHTMFIQDVVSDLNRKSHLEQVTLEQQIEINELKAMVNAQKDSIYQLTEFANAFSEESFVLFYDGGKVVSYDMMMDKASDLTHSTHAQCLANVKADAVEEFAMRMGVRSSKALSNYVNNLRKTMITTSSESSLSEVVNKINEEL